MESPASLDDITPPCLDPPGGGAKGPKPKGATH